MILLGIAFVVMCFCLARLFWYLLRCLWPKRATPAVALVLDPPPRRAPKSSAKLSIRERLFWRLPVEVIGPMGLEMLDPMNPLYERLYAHIITGGKKS